MCWWYPQAMYLWGVVGYDNTREPPFSILKKNIYIYILWGANDLWARPIYPGRIQRPKPKKTMVQARQDSLWVPPRVVQSSADPKYPQKEG